jgi:hypothetical protein
VSASIAGQGLSGDAGMIRALRNSPPGQIRQPYLGSPPAIFGLSGFGVGSGAFIRNQGSDADQSQGLVVIQVGLNPLATGVIQLSFPAGIVAGQYVFLADWATFVLAYATPVLQATWTGTRPIQPQETLLAAYQWAVST